MTNDDFVIDNLVDVEGRFFGRNAPAQGWLRPIRTECRRRNLRDLLEGRFKGRLLSTPDMEFFVTVPWAALRDHAKFLKPKPGILDDFLKLQSAPDKKIYEFASKFGPLFAFCEVDPGKEGHQLVVGEYSEVWRYIAASMNSLLRIAARFYAKLPADQKDWDKIGNAMAPVRLAVSKIKSGDWPDAQPFPPEADWAAMARIIERGHSRTQEMWVTLLNALLRIGRARPFVVWNRSSRPQLVFSSPGLLSFLTLQLCLRALQQDAFVSCSHCNREYTPIRAPKAGQRNYCPKCREAGVPARDAQRTHRARRRRVARG